MKYTKEDITNNMGLVFNTAKRMRHLEASGIIEFQDLISDGVIGLIHALRLFDPERGYKFSTYAVKCIWGSMLQGHRTLHMEQWKAKWSEHDVPAFKISIHQPMFDSQEVKEVVGADDRGVNAKAIFDSTANRCLWDKILSQLAPRQRQTVEMVCAGLTQSQIASRLGISRQCVSRDMRIMVTNAREYFTQEKEVA